MSSWKLVIKDLQGKILNVEVSNPQTSTVHDVKRLISQQDADMPVFEQRLVFERTELEDERKLSSYPDIKNESQLSLIRLIPFQIFVKGMDGSSYTFRIPSRTPQTFGVSTFKKLVQERTHIRPEEQRLQYAGKELVDRMSLGDYNMVNNATLHLVSRLRGGMSGCLTAVRMPGTCILTKTYTSSTFRMSCGHAVSSKALYDHCTCAMRKGKDRILCPVCSAEWSMKDIKLKTDLSQPQLQAIEDGINRNFLLSLPGVITCKGCGSIYSSSNASHAAVDRVCASCAVKEHDGKKATVELLAVCALKTIDYVTNCPVLRACPNCCNVIEHESACRRVDCNRCKTTFCFVCLKIRSPSCPEYYPCLQQKCLLTAPRQTVLLH